MKVLVIDACEVARARSIDALRDLAGVAIHDAVGTLHAARRALDAGAPEVVVTDVELPDGDYRDVIEAAQRRDPPPAIVVFSECDAPELARRTIADGADLYLTKSAGVAELQRGVLELAPRRRGQDTVTDRMALLGRLTAGVAHDLANYLGVVDASLALAQRHAGAAVEREIAYARRAVDSTTALLHSLLAYARGGAPAPAVLDLREVVVRVLDVFARAIPEHVLVVLDLAGSEVPVLGVAPELEQLLLNLVLNACDAMPSGGELSVRVHHAGGAVRLEVADRGGGVPAAAAVAGGVAPSSKRARVGGGLGLGIVRAVAERHDAALNIGRRAGGGACVGITFRAA